ncbi:hypothetical protein ACFO3J_20990 [Streptomyces polygonati]|uniref:DUF222 domain-containing protein n=1 Tax=Streptomyces polygonati TaxID=1617087 RepID=A0ABV8HPG1_9ACTN
MRRDMDGRAGDSGGGADTEGIGPGPRVTLDLADLARSVVAATAPEQLELLERIPARWTSERAAGRPEAVGWTGGTVASGMTPTVLSELVYPLLTGVFTQVLGTTALLGWQHRRWLRRRPAEPPVARVRLSLDADQIERFRAACVTHGETLGLSAAEAALLADALYGALQQEMDDPRPRA